jgi:hypothetical protein
MGRVSAIGAMDIGKRSEMYSARELDAREPI